ncbi:MAG TPA: glycosyltransferase [Gemmatimonadaceae bacterium]|nr:glycosyltransferase [Gemmatimonadaceae bacterium]
MPMLSVIVPVHQAETALPKTLAALAASDYRRDQWELIVVDDASTDGTAKVAAKWADRVLRLPGRPHGPAFARNRGVEASRGTWVVFIDADVVVHADTLRRFVTVVEADPGIDAVFGSYDDTPSSPDFLSQYRNLLHRYVHLEGAGKADTFWAGCGAVSRSAFLAAGGFDERRYVRPQIEDIELGYRLLDRGGRIALSPLIQGAHLKRWRFWGSVRTDLFDRGIPWVRLLLERGGLGRRANLNLKHGERIKTALVGLALLLLAVAILWRRPELAFSGVILLLAVVLSNLPLVVWFARRRGALFALATVPLNIWYYVLSGFAVVIGFGLHLADGCPRVKRRDSTEMALDTGRRHSAP